MSSFPTCQVCHQQFSLKGPAPFLFPCLHAVCETCVTSAAGGVISCSPCQRDVNLTETHLQKDVVREKEILHLTVKHQPELVLCTHEEDGNQAVCWCKECEDFLCEHCQMVHNSFKGTRKHTVRDIGELELGDLDEDNYCTLHPKHILDAWDENCGILMCVKCRFGDHAGHKVVDTDEVAGTAKREIAAFAQKVQSTVEKHGAKSTEIGHDLHSADETCNILSEKITHTFNDMTVLFNQKQKELQIEFQQYRERVREELTEKKNLSEVCHQRCKTTSDYIHKTLHYSSRHDTTSLKHILQHKTEECISSAQESVHESPPLPAFNTDGLEKLKSVLSGFAITPSKDESGAVKNIKDSETQTRDSVSSECENLKKELVQLEKDNQALKMENQVLKENLTREKMEERYGLYRLKANVTDIAYLLNCIHIEFSKTKYNAEYVHISTEGELVNEEESNPPYSGHRLKKYEGTSNIVPLKRFGCPQYFEVKSRVDIEDIVEYENLLLEIGLAREEEKDKNHYLDGEPQTYSLIVQQCSAHNSICRRVWRHSKLLTCLPDTLENTPGTSATLHYGVVYDSARSRIAFLDVKNEKIVCRIRNFMSSATLWPMFGVYNPDCAFVSMSLAVGSDIDMTERKKALILKSLS